MKKVSFDFDSTLDNEYIQKYAIELIDKGYDVHIVTSRPPKGSEWNINNWNNDDLYEIAEVLGIKKENIHFMDYAPKYRFFKNENFLFHLDDDHIEIEEINYHTKIKGVLLDGKWKENCDELIK